MLIHLSTKKRGQTQERGNLFEEKTKFYHPDGFGSSAADQSDLIFCHGALHYSFASSGYFPFSSAVDTEAYDKLSIWPSANDLCVRSSQIAHQRFFYACVDDVVFLCFFHSTLALTKRLHRLFQSTKFLFEKQDASFLARVLFCSFIFVSHHPLDCCQFLQTSIHPSEPEHSSNSSGDSWTVLLAVPQAA